MLGQFIGALVLLGLAVALIAESRFDREDDGAARAARRGERWLAELKAELEELPADRQEQFKRELEEGKEH
jgi:hypothetical protein